MFKLCAKKGLYLYYLRELTIILHLIQPLIYEENLI